MHSINSCVVYFLKDVLSKKSVMDLARGLDLYDKLQIVAIELFPSSLSSYFFLKDKVYTDIKSVVDGHLSWPAKPLIYNLVIDTFSQMSTYCNTFVIAWLFLLM